MVDSHTQAAVATGTTAAEQNKTLRSTYRLLSMTLFFSAITAYTSFALNLPHPGFIITLAGYFGLLFLTSYLRNSAWGILSVFALTGFFLSHVPDSHLDAFLSRVRLRDQRDRLDGDRRGLDVDGELVGR